MDETDIPLTTCEVLSYIYFFLSPCIYIYLSIYKARVSFSINVCLLLGKKPVL